MRRRESGPAGASLIARHLRFGWCAILVSVLLGAGLETLHGFKVAWYLGVASESRRLMWTLAHAHGTLLGLVNVAFAATLALRPPPVRRQRMASSCLIAATVLIPAGFFLGGCFIYAGDPGLPVLLVPPGAALLVWGLVLIV